jgi:hypothetical protein
MERENQMFIISLLVVICLTAILTFIPVWQLIFIPGLIAGLLNKQLKKAVIAGTTGIFLYWLLYIIDGVIFEKIYPLFDQFGALIIGESFGWLIILLILLFGAIFGLFGSFIGNKAFLIFEILRKRKQYQRN